jgi:hypothetical protein
MFDGTQMSVNCAMPPPPPPVGPPPPQQFDVILNGQYTSLSVLFTRLVSMLRDQTHALSGVTDALSTDIVSPCALTYEIFGRMARTALEKIETRDLGAIKGAQVLQSMLHNIKNELKDFRCEEETLHEQQAVALIERAVCEASAAVDGVFKKLHESPVEQSSGKRPRCELATHGEVEGVVVAALPAVLRVVVWLVHAVENNSVLKAENEESRRVLDDLRGLVLSLEIAKTSLKSMIDMNEQLVAGFTRQMMLAERRDVGRETSQQQLTTEVSVVRTYLAAAERDVKTYKRSLDISMFMVTDIDGRVREWGELAHHVTGIMPIEGADIDLRAVFCEPGIFDETLAMLKRGAQDDPMLIANRVHMCTFDKDGNLAEKKGFVSLKAVVFTRDEDQRASSILWIGEDITRESDMIAKNARRVVRVRCELDEVKTENDALRARLGEVDLENKNMVQLVQEKEGELRTVSTALEKERAEAESLRHELAKYKDFVSSLESLKSNLGGA